MSPFERLKRIRWCKLQGMNQLTIHFKVTCKIHPCGFQPIAHLTVISNGKVGFFASTNIHTSFAQLIANHLDNGWQIYGISNHFETDRERMEDGFHELMEDGLKTENKLEMEIYGNRCEGGFFFK